MKRFWIWIAVAALLAGCGGEPQVGSGTGGGTGTPTAAPHSEASSAVKQVAALKDLDDRAVNEKELVGKVVVLNFWAWS